MTQALKQNLTLSLAMRPTYISGLVAEQVEALVGFDDRHQRATASAVARVERGFHLGGGTLVSPDELHDR